MTCQRAGFITAMNPGGSEQLSLSLDGRRGRRRRKEDGRKGGGGITQRRHFILITAQLRSNQFDKFPPRSLLGDVSGK